MSKKSKKELSLVPCNKDHKPVWYYDDSSCPVCAAKILIEEYENDLQEMREELLDVETEVERLRGEVSELEDKQR